MDSCLAAIITIVVICVFFEIGLGIAILIGRIPAIRRRREAFLSRFPDDEEGW